MSLRQKIETDLKQAMRDKNEIVLGTLRMVNAAIQNKEIELRPKKEELTEEKIMSVLQSEIKKRKDSVEAYTAGGRQDLADKEKKEIEIISQYLPKELSEEELKDIVKKVIGEVKPAGPVDFGKVMGRVMKEVKGRAGGDKVTAMVKEELEKI